MGVLSEYSTLEEKDEFFSNHCIDTKTQFDELFTSAKEDTSIWRGMCEAKYKHYTSLQRFWLTMELDKNKEDVYEYLSHAVSHAKNWQNNFLSRYYGNFKNKDFGLDFFSILSILRHHGTPTPLVDWTKDFKVGLFFAADSTVTTSNNSIDNYFSLYEIKTDHPFNTVDIKSLLIRNLDQVLDGLNLIKQKDSKKEFSIGVSEFLEKTSDPDDRMSFLKESIKTTLGSKSNLDDFPYKVEDKETDKFHWNINNNFQITNQQGLFVYNIHPDAPLDEVYNRQIPIVLKELSSEQVKIRLEVFRKNFHCYNIHKNLKWYVLKKLSESGITKNFIYPNLDDLAESISKSFLEKDPIKQANYEHSN